MQSIFGLYIHWPFCESKCPYCDFNSHVSNSIDEQAWDTAYQKELYRYADLIKGKKLKSIFFGGGTPSLMPPFITKNIIQTAKKLWDYDDDLEISLEGNPGSVDEKNYEGYKKAGVNRVSLGIQSLYDTDLAYLGRKHNRSDALRAINIAKNLFHNVSIDLIYTRSQDQTLSQWEDELKEALSFNLNHYSLYQLTIEQGTQFHTLYQRGSLKLPNDNRSANFYELTNSIMASHYRPLYEISNYAKPGFECQHNLIYWQYQDYIGIGPGAHGRFSVNNNRYAVKQYKTPQKWLETDLKDQEKIALDQETQGYEQLLMNLRLKKGLLWKDIQISLNQEKLKTLQKESLIEIDSNYLRTTDEGRLRLNAILDYLLT